MSNGSDSEQLSEANESRAGLSDPVNQNIADILELEQRETAAQSAAQRLLEAVSRRAAQPSYLLVVLLFSKTFYLASINSYYTFYLIDTFHVSVQMAQVMRDEMSWDKLRPMTVQIYKEVFTQEEVDGMIAYYKTPAGAATVDKMPIVMQKSLQMMQARMVPMMQKMQAAMRQAVQDSKAVK